MKIMKKIILLAATIFLGSQILLAQFSVPVDKSPLDVSYYPVNYPSMKLRGTKEVPVMRVLYSRPYKNGRELFGTNIVPYDKVWRLGANEATEIDFFTDVTVNGKKIDKGRYTLYCIPQENEWTFIINRETDIWGSFKYDEAKDVVRVTVPVKEVKEPIESLTITFEKTASGANLLAGWDKKTASFPINF